jgi:RimJ/RimL family protein N-acetyltransferase
VRVIERQFSDFLRHPKDVARDVETSDVLLRRRDEPDLVLCRADRDEERTEAFEALSRTIRTLATQHPEALEAALDTSFAWTSFLSTEDRTLFVREFATVVVASCEINNYEPVGQFLREWRATAEIMASPSLAARLRESVTTAGDPIPRP